MMITEGEFAIQDLCFRKITAGCQSERGHSLEERVSTRDLNSPADERDMHVE